MTVEEAIKQLKELVEEGHGDKELEYNDYYRWQPVRFFIYEDKIGIQ